MAIKNDSFRDMEKDKFVESSSRPTFPAVEVTIGNPQEVGGALPFTWNAFTVDRAGADFDVYNYTYNAVAVGSVTINYTSNNKKEISGGSISVV